MLRLGTRAISGALRVQRCAVSGGHLHHLAAARLASPSLVLAQTCTSKTTFAAANPAVFVYRGYAKKSSAKAGKGKAVEEDDEAEEIDLDALLDTDTAKGLMDASIDHLKKEFSRLRTRIGPGLLENVKVNGNAPLKSLAQIMTKDAFSLHVNVFEAHDVDAVETAIRDAGLNLSTARDGKLIKATQPKTTMEHRQTLARTAKDLGEQCKATIKRARQKAIDTAKKASKHVSEDDIKRFEKAVQALTDASNKHVDDLVVTKSKEIMTI